MNQRLYVGVELGGTNCSIAIGVRESEESYNFKIVDKITIPTEEPDTTTKNIIEWVRKHDKVDQLGIASFGPICLDKENPAYGYITSTPKLKWQNFPLGSTLMQGLGLSGYGFDTDVNACAMAEFKIGGHKVRQSLAYITIGTGIGVGMIINGQCVHGLLHPEGGHVRVNKLEQDKDFKGVCAFHGDCLEGLCTNVSLSTQLKCSITDLPNVSDDHEIWQKTGYYLANLCLNITLLCSVEAIILGGGVMNRKILYPIIRQELKKLLNNYIQTEKLMGDLNDYIRAPGLGNDVGVIGAFLLQN